jgi:hypothetical protein
MLGCLGVVLLAVLVLVLLALLAS